MNPVNYKRQSALIKALERKSHEAMTVSNAWWYESAKYALIHNFGWEEKAASKFVVAYKSGVSAYRATSLGV